MEKVIKVYAAVSQGTTLSLLVWRRTGLLGQFHMRFYVNIVGSQENHAIHARFCMMLAQQPGKKSQHRAFIAQQPSNGKPNSIHDAFTICK